MCCKIVNNMSKVVQSIWRCTSTLGLLMRSLQKVIYSVWTLKPVDRWQLRRFKGVSQRGPLRFLRWESHVSLTAYLQDRHELTWLRLFSASYFYFTLTCSISVFLHLQGLHHCRTGAPMELSEMTPLIQHLLWLFLSLSPLLSFDLFEW